MFKQCSDDHTFFINSKVAYISKEDVYTLFNIVGLFPTGIFMLTAVKTYYVEYQKAMFYCSDVLNHIIQYSRVITKLPVLLVYKANQYSERVINWSQTTNGDRVQSLTETVLLRPIFNDPMSVGISLYLCYHYTLFWDIPILNTVLYSSYFHYTELENNQF